MRSKFSILMVFGLVAATAFAAIGFGAIPQGLNAVPNGQGGTTDGGQITFTSTPPDALIDGTHEAEFIDTDGDGFIDVIRIHFPGGVELFVINNDEDYPLIGGGGADELKRISWETWPTSPASVTFEGDFSNAAPGTCSFTGHLD